MSSNSHVGPKVPDAYSGHPMLVKMDIAAVFI